MERTPVACAPTAALHVADFFLIVAAAEEEPDYLSSLRLQKLLYYAQALSLAIRDRPLFREDIEAWIDGPVVPTVFARFADSADRRIAPSSTFVWLSAEDDEFVRSVWKAYKGYSATAIRKMTQYEAPWRLADRGPSNGGAPAIMTHESMKDYFALQATAH